MSLMQTLTLKLSYKLLIFPQFFLCLLTLIFLSFVRKKYLHNLRVRFFKEKEIRGLIHVKGQIYRSGNANANKNIDDSYNASLGR